MAVSFNSVGAEFPENDCMQNPHLCETVTLIDFDENTTVENSSMTFLDWTTPLKDIYTASVGTGVTTILGKTGGYNFQGVQGTTKNQFYDGEYLVFTLKNNTSDVLSFRPKLSFDDYDRVGMGFADGIWLELEPVTLMPNQVFDYKYHFDASYTTPPAAALVNFNMNIVGDQVVSLEKIEYMRRMYPVDKALSCDYFNCNTYTVVDFSLGTLQDIKNSNQLAAFDTVSYDVTKVILDKTGTGLTLKSEVTGGSHLYYSVRMSEGTHEFKVGEKIIVELANMTPQEKTLTPYISFTDYDNKPWGVTGTWYDFPTEVVSPYFLNKRFEFVIDENTAGSFSVINVAVHDLDVSIKKIYYETAQSLKGNFQ